MLLNVHEWGRRDAQPVVCLHGVTAHGLRFAKLAEERLASRFRVLAPDLRGHGRSEWEPPWGLADHVADVRETLAAAGVERAAFVGHSFGGRLVLELTALGLVERSVLIDPAVWVPPPIALARAEEERVERSFETVEDAIAARTPTAALAPLELLEQELRDHLVRGDDGRLRYRYLRSAVVAAYGELTRPPPDWAQLRVPTLLVAGATSDIVPEVVVELLRSELEGVLEIEIVPGGHSPLWDAYDATAEAIKRFLG